MRFIYGHMTFDFSPDVLTALTRQRQLSRMATENGGQLFARFAAGKVQVEAVTLTKGKSKRKRYGFWPDRDTERIDIEQFFSRRLHYVGDWHSHPEPAPSPSRRDKTKMLEIFRQSKHELGAMLMVVIGQLEFPEGLYVGAVTDTGVVDLVAETS